MNEKILTFAEYQAMRERIAVARLACQAGKSIPQPRAVDIESEFNRMTMAAAHGAKVLPDVKLSDATAYLATLGVEVPKASPPKFTN